MKKKFMKKLMAAAILTVIAASPSWADDITSLQDLKNALGETIYANGGATLRASSQSDQFVENKQKHSISLADPSFTSLGNGIYEVTYDASGDGAHLLFTVENGIVVKIEEPTGAGFCPKGEYVPYELGAFARNGCEEHMHAIYAGNGYFHVCYGDEITDLFERAEGLDTTGMKVGKVYHVVDISGPACVLCDKATYTLSNPIPDLDPDAEYVVMTYREGGETKTVICKTTDLETIEWKKGSDIAE